MSIYHRGPFLHNGHGPRGSGFGSILSSLFKTIIPVVSKIGRSFISSDITKSALRGVKNAAIESGVSLATDVLRGEDIETSAKKNLEKARHTVADAVESSLKKRSYPSNKKVSKRPKKAKRARKAKDIFF